MFGVRKSTAEVVRVLIGLALIQLALPKLFPLPGVSDRWLLIFAGGGVAGVFASIVGGTIVLAYGVTLLPRPQWSPGRWGVAAALVALATRAVAVLLVFMLAGTLPTRYPWGTLLPAWLSLVTVLALVALAYGGLTASVVGLVRRAVQS